LQECGPFLVPYKKHWVTHWVTSDFDSPPWGKIEGFLGHFQRKQSGFVIPRQSAARILL